MKDLREQPWWTLADRAELDAIVHQLIDSVHSHRESACEVCAAGFPPCPKVQRAIAIAGGWRDARIVLSQARWLRSGQALVEFEQELRQA